MDTRLVAEGTGNDGVIALSADTISNIQKNRKLYDGYESLFGSRFFFLFMYRVSARPCTNSTLFSTSDGMIKSFDLFGI